MCSYPNRWLEILDKVACVLLRVNNFGKGMNQSVRPAMIGR